MREGSLCVVPTSGNGMLQASLYEAGASQEAHEKCLHFAREWLYTEAKGNAALAEPNQQIRCVLQSLHAMGRTERIRMSHLNENVIWKDRKHWLWFPFSFTKYELTKDRLHVQRGFFKTVYDETLLYRIVDVRLVRTFGQKLCGTGTVEVYTRVDVQKVIELKNIKNCQVVNRLIADMVEDIRTEKKIVGREFNGIMGGRMNPEAFDEADDEDGDASERD